MAKSSTIFGWGESEKVTTAGWQVILCKPISHVIPSSSVVISITKCCVRFRPRYLFYRHYPIRFDWRSDRTGRDGVEWVCSRLYVAVLKPYFCNTTVHHNIPDWHCPATPAEKSEYGSCRRQCVLAGRMWCHPTWTTSRSPPWERQTRPYLEQVRTWNGTSDDTRTHSLPVSDHDRRLPAVED